MIARLSEREARLYRGRGMARRRVECPVCREIEIVAPVGRGAVVKFTCESCGHQEVVEIS